MTRSTNRSRARRNPKNRSLNAFAIAQSQVTEKSPVPKYRLGQAPSKGKKRARRDDDGEGGDDDEEPRDRRPRRDDEESVDGGSDSDGGHWKVGVDGDGDGGSDIDSDEAMGESDEGRFVDFTFRGSSSTGKVNQGKAKAKLVDLDESEEEDNESEEDVEGFIDLSEMLDRAETSSNGDKKSTKKQKPKYKKHAAPESELEDGDEDDSMSSANDEPSNGNDPDTDSFTHFSDEEEDTPEDPTKLAALQSLISSLPSTSTQPATKRIRLDDPNERKTPNKYNLSLGSPSQKLTVDDLMPSITDPTLKKALKVLSDTTPTGTQSSGVQGRLSAPLAKRQQDRIDRAAAYVKTNETLGRWVDTVKTNREADHLHFPLANTPNAPIKAPNRLSAITPSNSTPLTTLEATISGILQDSNMISEKQVKGFEELKTNKLSIEEVQKRTAELRIARELLYREEVKAKRIKKIKSKAYHRIHKKERMRQEQAIEEALGIKKGGVLGEEIMEQERKRAEERMTLRHSQSKWAKGTKESGRSVWDDEAQNGANEMARHAEELKRRVQGKDVPSNESGFESSSSSSESDDEPNEEGVGVRKRLLKDIEKAEASLGVVSGGAGKLGGRLIGMRFMQNAEAARKKENDASLQELKNSLEDGDKMSGDAESDEEPKQTNSRMTFKPGKKDDGLAAPKTNRSKFEEADMSDREEEQDGGRDGEVTFVNKASAASTTPKNPFSAPKTTTGKAGGKHISFRANKEDDPTPLANPWLTQDPNVTLAKPKQLPIAGKQESKAERASKKLTRNKKAALKSRNPSENEEVEIDTSVTLKLAPKKLANPDDDDEVDDKEVNLIPTKGAKGDNEDQRELVERAFAGDNVVLDFTKEKKQVVEDEGDQVIDKTLPGWGSWTGEGLDPKRYKGTPKKQFLKTVQGIAQDKRKDSRLAKVIINEKRVKKNVKYNASNLPHPFETKQQYERSLRVPIGPEWATKVTFQDSTMPRVMVRKGVVVEAISAPFK